jgi:hypothetical protein
MKKQTAVEWLEELIECGADLELIKLSIVRAKALEKEQIIDAIRYGFFILRDGEDAEQCFTSNYE